MPDLDTPRRIARVLVPAVLLSLLSTTHVLARGSIGDREKHIFDMDENGSRPRGYRISALAREFEDGLGLSLYIYRNALITALAGADIFQAASLGIQDGKRVLTSDCVVKGGTVIIGDAEDLDNIVLAPGLKMSVVREYSAWVVDCGIRCDFVVPEPARLKPFTGRPLTTADVVGWLAEWARTGNALGESNVKVSLTIVNHFYGRYTALVQSLSGGSHQERVDAVVKAHREAVVTPLEAVATGATGPVKQRLRQIVETAGDGLSSEYKRVLKELKRYGQNPPPHASILVMIRQALEGCAADLERVKKSVE